MRIRLTRPDPHEREIMKRFETIVASLLVALATAGGSTKLH